MPSSASAGYKGVFKIGATAMIQVRDIELQVNGMTYDVTVMSGASTPQWKAFLAGLLDWTIKIVGNYDQVNDAVQATLWTNLTTGVVNAITFSPNTGTNNFTGNALLKAMPIKVPVAAQEDVTFEFQGTGALSYA